MIGAILEGISYGLILSALTGPIFFSILQVSIEKGTKAGTVLVAGQWFSDFIYIGFTFLGAEYMEQLQQDEAIRGPLTFYLGIAGSIFLAILGIVLILAKPSKLEDGATIKNKSLPGYFLQGFLLNTLTPFPLFFWVSLMSSLVGRGYEDPKILSLCISVMIVVVLTDLLKVYGAKYLSRFLSERTILVVRRLAGLALVGFGIFLFYRIFFF